MKTRTLTNLALLVAVSIVLTRFFGIMVPLAGIPGLRLSFGDVPIILAGILFGPLAGAVTGVLADLLGMAIFSWGQPFFPGFTLSAALTGIIPALVLGKARKDPTVARLILAIAVNGIIVNIMLDSFWLVMMYNKALAALLPARIVARALLVPTDGVLIYLIVRRYLALQPRTAANRTI